MSNYVQVVSYGPKDLLANGDPNKVIKGTQIDGELGAISTSIATKLDSSGVSLTYNTKDLTPDNGSFTGTLTGFTPSSLSITCTWVRMGNVLAITLGGNTGTSNVNTMTITGVPSTIMPTTTTQLVAVPFACIEDNGVQGQNCTAVITAGGTTISLLKNTGPWTTSGTKGITGGFTILYHLK